MRIHLFGASGSGVTTLGRHIGGLLNIPYFDSDSYFWIPTDPPYVQRRPPDQRNRLLQADLSTSDSWIFGGSIIHWGEGLLPPVDLCVFLWLPPGVRMTRLKQRELDRYGGRLFHNPEYQEQHKAFLAWAADYDQPTGLANRTLPAHEAWLATHSGPKLEIRGDYSTEQRWAFIRERLGLPEPTSTHVSGETPQESFPHTS